ncbi:CPBP family intramembrane glutamic endopeptidase [Agrococcus carbonis]|uniref:CAAX protease self-immunity n=1 Tax=Agrococcus carbonis TaxID=684552 RepID=A0A1H1MY39_9MICO|nr:CPBP family intramembrane glutamic endopeptidase [Agrococcus carbonis]SDR90839.1 CAAX protease self-immunity [Agrococcus carbonis]
MHGPDTPRADVRTASGADRRRTILTFLLIAYGWAALVGLGLFLTRTPLDSIAGIAAMGLLVMPSPFVAALIAERGMRRDRLRLPRRGGVLVFLVAPVAAVLAFVALFVAAHLTGGNLLGLPLLGLATTDAEILAGAAALLGSDAVAGAGAPPPLPVLLAAAMLMAVVAGWTVNGLVAMGEEYGWRGLLWEQLRHLGVVRANLLVGTAWGLWHTPLILQGYNYGGAPLGVVAMVVFCIAMSFVLSAIRERTGSVVPVAAAHGILNAVVPSFLIVAPGADAVLTAPLGLLGSALMLVVGAAAWRLARRGVSRTAATERLTVVA